MPLPLQHPDLDDFEITVRRLVHLAHESGGTFLRAEGLGPEDLPHNPKARRIFLHKCHYGFDLAQRQIGKLAVEYERRVRALEAEVKALRRSRDERVDTVEYLVAVLENRQFVLRRILDSILFAVLLPDTSIQRRLTSNEEIRAIDPEVVAHTLEIAVERNKEDRARFNIVADLTTVIHYGDLLEIDKSRPRDRPWRLIELKEGKVNELIAAELSNQDNVSTEDAITALEAFHGKAVAKQARRMVRQQQRLSRLDDIVDKDIGIEPYVGDLFVRSHEMVKLSDYKAAIRRAYAQAQAHGAGGAEVSDCITIIAIGRAAPEYEIRGAVAHACYHSRHREAPCLLNDADRVNDELRAKRAQAPIVDLIETNIRAAQAEPIFIWTAHEMVLDFLFGRVRLFAQFDIEEFFKYANGKLGVKCSWVAGKENQDLAKYSQVIPGSPGSRGVQVEYPDGKTERFLSGFFARAILQFVTPDDLVKMIRDLPTAQRHVPPED